jgi:transcriptional regulator with XRE-family HTH domain
MANEVDKHVGARVRRRRRALGLTQTKVAKALGITFQQVQKYENGTNRISASRLEEISRVLKVSAAYFFEGLPKVDGIDDSGASQLVSTLVGTEDGLALAKAFMCIRNPKVRNLIVQLAEQLGGPSESRPPDSAIGRRAEGVEEIRLSSSSSHGHKPIDDAVRQRS